MRKKNGRRLICLAAAFLLIIMSAGCGQSQSAPVAESASEDTTEAAQIAETVAVVEEPKLTTETAKVGVCFARSENGDNERLLYELKRSLDLQGFEEENVLVKRLTGSRSTQAAEVGECLSQGCSVVIIAAVSDRRIPDLADQVAEGGASAVFVNCTPDEEELGRWAENDLPMVWIGSTPEEKTACQMTILYDYSGTDEGIDFNGDGHIGALLVGEDDAAREKLEETISDLGSELKILGETDSGDFGEISLFTQENLNEYRKEVELILCSTDAGAQAASDGVQLRHRLVGRDIMIIGADAHEDSCAMIINKLMSGSTFTDFYEQANLTAVAAKDLIEGNQAEKKIASVIFKVTEGNSQEVLDQLWNTKEKAEEAVRKAEEEAEKAAAASTGDTAAAEVESGSTAATAAESDSAATSATAAEIAAMEISGSTASTAAAEIAAENISGVTTVPAGEKAGTGSR